MSLVQATNQFALFSNSYSLTMKTEFDHPWNSLKTTCKLYDRSCVYGWLFKITTRIRQDSTSSWGTNTQPRLSILSVSNVPFRIYVIMMGKYKGSWCCVRIWERELIILRRLQHRKKLSVWTTWIGLSNICFYCFWRFPTQLAIHNL